MLHLLEYDGAERSIAFLRNPFPHCIFTSILYYPSRCSSNSTSSFQISLAKHHLSLAKHHLTLLWTYLAVAQNSHYMEITEDAFEKQCLGATRDQNSEKAMAPHSSTLA